MINRVLTLMLAICLCRFIVIASDPMLYEYWLDSAYSQHITNSVPDDGKININENVSNLDVGVHCLSFRVIQGNEIGPLNRYMFYIGDLGESIYTAPAYYEYWFDSDYADHATKDTFNHGKITIGADISKLTPGVHFFNFRTYHAETHRFSPLNRNAFYIPDYNLIDAALPTSYEYWIDADRSTLKRVSNEKLSFSFSVDVSDLENGIHCLHFRALNNIQPGTLYNVIFYVFKPIEVDVFGYRYWIDYDEPTEILTEERSLHIDINVSNLENGTHSFNYQTLNIFGQGGEIHTELFEVLPFDGIEQILPDSELYNVFNLDGVQLLKGGTRQELKQLHTGLYIINGTKVYIR